jgi:hypothetical protein
MAMTRVTFLPWLGLHQETTIAGVDLVPWDRFQEAGSLGETEIGWLSLYFNRYRARDGETPVGSVTVVRAHDTDDEGEATAYRTVRATAAASLVYEHAGALSRGNPTMPPPRGERFLVFTQRFDPEERFVALGEGYAMNVWPLDSFVEIEPLTGGEDVGRIDSGVVHMAEALLRQDDDQAAALDLLVEGSMTSNRHLGRLNFVFLGSALELLAQAGGQQQKAAHIGEALARAVREARNGYPTAGDEWERAATRARRADPELVRVWMAGCTACNREACAQHRQRYRGFYGRRNKIIHEGGAGRDVLLHQRPDTGELHRWPTQVGRGGGAHACDVALVMAGWLFLSRVGHLLERNAWARWCNRLDEASAALGFQ